MGLLSRKKSESVPGQKLAILEPENPVNYDSVLDYLVGLSQRDYDRIIKVTTIYRDANKSAAKVLGVKDQPTHQLKHDKPTDDQVDDELDAMLHADGVAGTFLTDGEPEEPEVKKEQAPSTKKVTINKE